MYFRDIFLDRGFTIENLSVSTVERKFRPFSYFAIKQIRYTTNENNSFYHGTESRVVAVCVPDDASLQ